MLSQLTNLAFPSSLFQAKRHETLLTARLSAISSSLSPSLARHSVQTHSDLLSTLLDHAKSNLLYEKQRLKEYETLRSEMKNIRKLEGGVVYHHDQSRSTFNASPRNNFSATTSSPLIGQRNSSSTSAPPMSPSPSASSATSNNARPQQTHDPLSPSTTKSDPRDLSSMAQKAQKRTVRSMASSVVVEGDRRQRVDVSLQRSLSILIGSCP
jgi:hypothetical protein